MEGANVVSAVYSFIVLLPPYPTPEACLCNLQICWGSVVILWSAFVHGVINMYLEPLWYCMSVFVFMVSCVVSEIFLNSGSKFRFSILSVSVAVAVSLWLLRKLYVICNFSACLLSMIPKFQARIFSMNYQLSYFLFKSSCCFENLYMNMLFITFLLKQFFFFSKSISVLNACHWLIFWWMRWVVCNAHRLMLRMSPSLCPIISVPRYQIMTNVIRVMRPLVWWKQKFILHEPFVYLLPESYWFDLNTAFFQRDVLDICPSSLTMAQQLTLIEMERLRHISPEEFVQAFANETSKLSAACRHAQSPVCIEAYTHWFNRLSYFVATEIIMVSTELFWIVRPG